MSVLGNAVPVVAVKAPPAHNRVVGLDVADAAGADRIGDDAHDGWLADIRKPGRTQARRDVPDDIGRDQGGQVGVHHAGHEMRHFKLFGCIAHDAVDVRIGDPSSAAVRCEFGLEAERYAADMAAHFALESGVCACASRNR